MATDLKGQNGDLRAPETVSASHHDADQSINNTRTPETIKSALPSDAASSDATPTAHNISTPTRLPVRSPSPRSFNNAASSSIAIGDPTAETRERPVSGHGRVPFLDGTSHDNLPTLNSMAGLTHSAMTENQPLSQQIHPSYTDSNPRLDSMKNSTPGLQSSSSFDNSDVESSGAWSPMSGMSGVDNGMSSIPSSASGNGYQPHMYPSASNGNGRWNGAPPRAPYRNDSISEKLGHSGFPLSSVDNDYNSPTMREKGGLASFQDSTGFWLGLYFFFNLGLTLFNKIVLVSFPFPYTLTGLHALSGCAGCYIALERGAFTPARLTSRENLILGAFSVLYTINIAVSNISLQLVTVPFHQVVRACTPLFTIIISTVVLRTKFSAMKLISLLPVVAGVGFATYGDYLFTAWGLILTLLGTFLAAMKTVATNLIQTGGGGRLKLHPLDLLMRMSPLAFIQCVVYSWWTGELERVRQYGATQMTRSKAIALLINGIIACGLNIVSFTANKKAGPLTMTVSANCKQVLTIALAVVLFDLHINFTNGIGIALTLLGGGWYGWVEYQEKQKKSLRLAEKS